MNLDLAAVRDDIAYERRRYDLAARSPYDGRLADADELAAAQRRRRERIAVLEEREKSLAAETL